MNPDPPESPDAALARRAREGDAAAWREIYERCHTPVYRYVHGRIWDEAAAEDIAAEVFVAAVRGIARYRYEQKPILAWLFGIAAHAVVDHQRGVGRRRRLLERLGLSAKPERASQRPTAPISVESEDEAVGRRLDLVAAIEQLNANQRECMTLLYLVGLSVTEVAEVLGRDASGIYSLRARALIQLRRTLGEEYFQPRDEFSASTAIPTVEADERVEPGSRTDAQHGPTRIRGGNAQDCVGEPC